MDKYGPVLDIDFTLVHFLPDGNKQRFTVKITKHPDSDGTRYATYPNGTGLVVGPAQFNRLMMSKVELPTPMPQRLRESLDLI